MTEVSVPSALADRFLIARARELAHSLRAAGPSITENLAAELLVQLADLAERKGAAVEAALRAAETWRVLAGDSQAPFDLAIASCAKTVRAAITAALTGKEEGDGD